MAATAARFGTVLLAQRTVGQALLEVVLADARPVELQEMTRKVKARRAILRQGGQHLAANQAIGKSISPDSRVFTTAYVT